MRLSVIGTGYLGAIHATCMAHIGHDVVAYDVDPDKISKLQAGTPPFFEPGFAELLSKALASGLLRFTDDPHEAIAGASVHFVCVGTPQLAGSDAADVSHVDSAFGMVADNLDRDGCIVGKSTVPVGTAQRLSHSLNNGAHEVQVAWNPEFLREGKAIRDTLHPDRLVLGVTTQRAERALKEVYEQLIESGTPCITTDLPTAEMVKVAANSFLATKISFINAMAEICEVAQADVVTLASALGYDDRIGAKFLNAGLGFGGGCLPKDIRAFSARAGELGAADALSFLREIDKINMRRRERVASTAQTMIGGDFLGQSVTVLGAAFKPDSDDVRDSPALSVAAAMHLKGADVRVHDPEAIDNARKRFPTLRYCSTIEEACENSSLLVLATEWSEYRMLDPHTVGGLVRDRRLLDARNAVDHEYWIESGWTVRALGRGNLDRSTGRSVGPLAP